MQATSFDSLPFTWDTDAERTWQTDLPPIPASARVLNLTLHSNKVSMLVVDVYLERPDAPGGHKTYFVVEWAGQQTISFRLSSFEASDAPLPKALQDEPVMGHAFPIRLASRLRLQVRDTTYPGTRLEIGPITCTEQLPLIPINASELLLEDFTAPRFWDLAEWSSTPRTTVQPQDGGLKCIWFYAELWYREQPGQTHRVSFTKPCRRDISAFQALSVSLGADRRALLSVILEIDGQQVALIDHRHGVGDGEEVRLPLTGKELTRITLELEEAPECAGQNQGQVISGIVRWLMLERNGADPATANEVRGMPRIEPVSPAKPLDEQVLPVGILFGRAELPALHTKIQTGLAKRIYAEIMAEANSHLDYRPEPHVGRYTPVDWGNSQGAGRMSAHVQEMVHYNSCMVYSGLAYLLSGQVEHGAAARRALLATLACDEWASGFVSRIPVGLPGYRAPFVTAGTACAVALCYDFIFPLLSPAERRLVEDRLYTKAIPWLDMYLRLYGEGYLLESNQGPVYSRGLIFAALVARRSHPDVVPLMDQWITWFQRMMTVCYDADGSTNEGPSYWEYTTHETVAALMAISRYVGKAALDLAPRNLLDSIDYILHMRSLSSEKLAFQSIGDCGSGESTYMSGIFLFFAQHLHDPRALWLWNTFYAQRTHAVGSPFFGSGSGQYVTEGLLTLLLLQEAPAPVPQLPPSKCFSVCERVFWRTGSAYGDTLLFFEGGRMIPGHAHLDKGQFLLEAYGERLVADPGMVNYADPASEALQMSMCHNVVTVKNRDQDYPDLRRAVVLEKLESNAAYSYLRADVSGSYRELDVFKRRLLFVRPDYFLVLDDIRSRESGVQWHLHSSGTLTLHGMRAHVDAPRAGMWVQLAGSCMLNTQSSAYYDGARLLTSNLTLTPSGDEPALWIAALLVPYPKGAASAAPQVSAAPLPGGVQFTIQGAWGEDTLTCCDGEQGACPCRIEVVRHNKHGGTEEFEVKD
jgi:hypothetical protein